MCFAKPGLAEPWLTTNFGCPPPYSYSSAPDLTAHTISSGRQDFNDGIEMKTNVQVEALDIEGQSLEGRFILR